MRSRATKEVHYHLVPLHDARMGSMCLAARFHYHLVPLHDARMGSMCLAARFDAKGRYLGGELCLSRRKAGRVLDAWRAKDRRRRRAGARARA